MAVDMPGATAGRRTPLVAWFFGAGLMELLAALLAAYVLHLQGTMMAVLLPPLLLAGDDPSTPDAAGLILQLLWVFGGTFLLYGLAGVIIGLTVRLWQRRKDGKPADG